MTDYILLDGAMGTYYQSLYGDDCFEANINHPEFILSIHNAYIEAGSTHILTNTFDASRRLEQGNNAIDLIRAACHIAAGTRATVIADIGPADSAAVWRSQVDVFVHEGIHWFLFETLGSTEGIKEITAYVKELDPQAVVAVSFAVGPDGMSRQGFDVRHLLEEAIDMEGVDIVGLNCMSSAYHLASILPMLDLKGKGLLVKPNSGYPKVVGHKVIYEGSPDYFARQCARMKAKGVTFFGGCCGTTPEHIKILKEELKHAEHEGADESAEHRNQIPDAGYLSRLKSQGHKILAVELDPPANDDIASFMRGLGLLKEAGADIITIADNPIGRPRADSALLACKIRRETGMEVLPHLTCRDRNLNAVKGLLLGLSIEDVHQVLVITGDPLPDEARSEVKSVYDFNSRRLAGYIRHLNESLFSCKMHVLGALDVNARNFDVQMRLAQEKIAQGMEGFLTQPVLSEKALHNLKRFRQAFPDCLLLAGIFPVVSWRNGQFLNSEVNGVHVCDEILALFENKDRAEGEKLAKQISKRIMAETADWCDGYYLMVPFQRVNLVCEIMRNHMGD